MPITRWPSAERPREKLLSQGPSSLSESELLAILFGHGFRGTSAVDLGRELLWDFGGLRALLAAPPSAWRAPHRGVRRYALLHASLELAHRHYAENADPGPALQTPPAVRDFLVRQLQERVEDAFYCLHLDNRHRLLALDELHRGPLDDSTISPREVVEQALQRNAAAVIFVHHRPAGPAMLPTERPVTERLRSALALVEIRVLDHLVVRNGRCVSYAERGLF